MPKVSVIMPVYNGEKFLAEAIESILAQTYKDYEFIIVCEYETSRESLEIISKYAEKDNRLNVIKNTFRLGIAASLNVGFRAANGEYLARMDGDDIALPDRLKIQVAYMEKNPDVAICCGKAVCIDDKGVKLNIKDSCSDDPEQLKSDLIFYCVIRHPTIILRTSSVYEHNLFYNENCVAAEDYELWCRVVHKITIVKIPEVILLYRWFRNNATHVYFDEGVKNYQETMRENLNRLGLDPNDGELRLLCSETCKETISNHRRVRKTIEKCCDDITESNKRLGLYDEICLKNTLDRRMYWKKHRMRGWCVIAIRSAAELSKIRHLTLLARHLEYNGFGATFKRIFLKG